MEIIFAEKTASGAYQGPQSWPLDHAPEGYLEILSGLDFSGFYEVGGFVSLDVKNGKVTGYAKNEEKYIKWAENHPAGGTQPAHTEEADMMQMLLDQEYRLTMLELTAGTAEI